MRVLVWFLVVLLFLVACSTQEVSDEVFPSDAELSSCSQDSDCVPLPSQCHPQRCINKDFVDAFEAPEFCTEIFVFDAAYTSEDCGCVNEVCTNLNAIQIPSNGVKCTFRGEVCDMKNQTVCGYYKPHVQCVTEPCAVTVTNPCEACNDPDIAYWVEGACEE